MIREEKGQSLVEMALILPVLLLLLVGIIDIGRMTIMYSSLHFTAQETVRLGGLGETDTELVQFARNNLSMGDPTKLLVDITPQPEMRESGEYITVNLDYTLTPFTPFIETIFPESLVLSVDSTIRIE
ncbi:TadE/TadG family type IV pilus assembly protein [Virgibacillus sp. DJP39]|uniref:TadE/TadG family type IV pilus assembly protein n=1 Tax=Virgibacillus sp. DJP39 TaxID=3409790 RepID=UPI003BB75CCA